jgi:ABC-2 type transport system ATP-binding protein
VASKPGIRIAQLHIDRGGRPVLPGVSLEVAAGRVTGLLGPSGSGKTTLIRAIVGVQIVRRGTVEVLGLPAGSPKLRPRVGYVTQAPSVYPDLSVRENLRYFATLVRVGPKRVDAVIATVALESYAEDVVQRLSAGQRSRVSLGAALLNEPDVLVLDEPTVGLDPVLRRELWELFHELARGGKTLLVSSHVMDEAERCDDLVLLRDGRIVAVDTPQALLERTGARNLDEAFLALVEAG